MSVVSNYKQYNPNLSLAKQWEIEACLDVSYSDGHKIQNLVYTSKPIKTEKGIFRFLREYRAISLNFLLV